MKLVYMKKILVLSLAFLLAFTSVPGIGSAFAETENTGSDAAEPGEVISLEENEESVEPLLAPLETFEVEFKASERGELTVTIYNKDGEIEEVRNLSNGESVKLNYPLGTRALVEATDDKDNGQVFEDFTIILDGKGKPHRVEGNQGDLLEFFFGGNFLVDDDTQGIIEYVSTWKSTNNNDDEDEDDDVIPNELPLITAPDLTLDASENPWNVMTGVVVSDLEDDQDPQKETVVVVRENDGSGQIIENLDITLPGTYVLYYTATDSDGGEATTTRTVTVEQVVIPKSYDGLGYIYITDPNGRIEKLDYAQISGTTGNPDNDDHVEFYFSNVTANQRKIREIGLLGIVGGIPQFAGINDENLNTNEAYIGRFDETTNSWVQYAQFDQTYNKAALAADSNGYFFYAVKNGNNMDIVRRKVYESGGYSGEVLTTFTNAQSLNDVADMVVYDGDLYVVYGEDYDAELYRIFLDNTNSYQAQLVTGYNKSLWTTGMAVDGSQIIFVGFSGNRDFVSIGTLSNDKSSISMTSAEYFSNPSAGNLLGAASSTPGDFTGKNLGPNAEDDNVSTAENQWVLIDVLDNDNDPENDPLQITAVTSPANGSVVIENNKVKYTPDPDFVGPDSFQYTIEDPTGNPATAIVTVTVVERVASSIIISGVSVINKTYNDPINETYSAVVYDQFNTIIAGAVITFEENQTYTQINNSGILSVDASHNTNGSPVKVTANSGSLSASLNVTINVSQPIMYPVTFDSNGGSSVLSQSIIEGEKVIEPSDPIRNGYSFDYWTYNGNEYDFDEAVNSPLILVAQWTANENTLSYEGNGNTSGQAPPSQDFLSDENIPVANEGDLEKEGYSFIGWNTQADGNGTSYNPGDSITGKDDIELFAQWTANENTLSYQGNGNTSGQAPQSQDFLSDENIPVANEGDLEKEGYSFIGWNTQANGSGTFYESGDSITGTDDIILYAQWTANENTLSYEGNGNTSGQAPPSQDFLSDENIPVANEGDLEKEGYSFIGWNTQADGNGTSYNPGDSITGKDDIELFAQWTANENTLSYQGNGNTSGQAPQSQDFLSDENIPVANEGDLEKEGYSFIGWNTQANGSGTFYESGDSITGTDDIILYAQWTANENILSYQGNGNTSGQAPPSQDFLTDENIPVASEGDLEKEGYSFIGWNTQADGNGTSYNTGDSITGTDDIILYAQWTLDPYVIITDPEGVEIGSEGVTLYIGTAYTANKGQSQFDFELVADQEIIDVSWEIVSGSSNIALPSDDLVQGLLETGGTPAVVRVNVVLSDQSVVSDEVNVFVIRGDLPVNPPVDPPTQPPVDPPAPTVSISLDRNPVELEYGSEALEEFLSYDLTETITGSSDPNVEWTIENPEIATVDQNGLVTAVEQGETTVTVRHIASGATASSTVIVFLVGEEENPLGAVQFFDPYIIGYPDQTFGPQRSVTRAEVATMFARILNLNLDFPGSPRFNDVSESTWYYKYIQASTRAGLFGGYSDGSFKPDAPITRGEIATVFSKYWDFLDIRVNALPTNALVDVDGSHWASEYIYKMYNTGIVKGFEDGSYRPNSNTLREQVVGMINTLIARPEYLPENTKYVDITKNHWAFGNIEAATTPYSAQTNLPIDVEN